MITGVIIFTWVVSKVSQAFDEKSFAQATLCDLIKTFDWVDFHDLVTKLQYYGLSKEPDLFLGTYLSNRRQEECIDTHWSHVASKSCCLRCPSWIYITFPYLHK